MGIDSRRPNTSPISFRTLITIEIIRPLYSYERKHAEDQEKCYKMMIGEMVIKFFDGFSIEYDSFKNQLIGQLTLLTVEDAHCPCSTTGE